MLFKEITNKQVLQEDITAVECMFHNEEIKKISIFEVKRIREKKERIMAILNKELQNL